MMLQEDQDKTIWFDCQEPQQEYFFDAHTSMKHLKGELKPNNKANRQANVVRCVNKSTTLANTTSYKRLILILVLILAL